MVGFYTVRRPERPGWAVRDALDRRLLNDVEGFGIPTTENIAAFVWNKLGELPQLQRVVVKRTQNGEGCEYFGPEGDVRR